MELEELRQRLLLRSKSSDIPPIAHPVQVPDLPLSQAASKVKWETSLPPEVTARVGNSGAKPETQGTKTGKEPAATRPENTASADTKEAGAASVAPAPEPISMLATTVGQLGAPTEAFREHFDKLGELLEPIAIATESAEQALARITGLHDHLAGLAKNFQSVKAFAEQVKMLSASFEPMKGLDTQLNLVVQALYSNVKEAGAALAPVTGFQSKVRQLASALDSIDELKAQISNLAEAFRPAGEDPLPAAGGSSAGNPSAIAQAA
jgi:hypothetical protein